LTALSLAVFVTTSIFATNNGVDSNEQIPITTGSPALTPSRPPSSSEQVSPQEALANADKYFKQLDKKMDDMMNSDPFFSNRMGNVPQNLNTLNGYPTPTSDFPQIRHYIKNNSAVLILIIPGMDKSNIRIQLRERTLIITGKHNKIITDNNQQAITPAAESQNDAIVPETDTARNEKNQYYEQITREFSQTATLPLYSDLSKITSVYKDGVLTITVPLIKKSNQDDKVIPIN